jgi:peptidoglycan L-alanyl-D-glutamate endopeptidase CwlK
MFKLSKRSLDRLQGVHPDLVKVVQLAITRTPIDFAITEGLRTKERQKELVAKGASTTMNSRHITGHAIDFACFIGKEVRWDWNLYNQVGPVFEECAKELGIPIVWGGRWRSFPDGPHVELDRRTYP